MQGSIITKGEEPKSRRPDPVIYRAFDLALLQREYRLWNISDLPLEDYWALEIVAQERHRWEAEMQHYSAEWRKQDAKIGFQEYLMFVPELEEFM